MSFDPDAAAAPGSGLFGLPDDPGAARVHVLGVPFDATTSFRKGAAGGPAAILKASHQVDLFDLRMEALGAPAPWEAGIWMAPLDKGVAAWNAEAGVHAERIIAAGGADPGDAGFADDLRRVDAIGAQVNEFVYQRTNAALEAGKLAALVGGDHSTPFGAIRAHAERHEGLGILHFDAHADLRVAFEGMRWSHASILHNVLGEQPQVGPVVQVGVRDIGAAEHERLQASRGWIRTLFGHEWAAARHGQQDLVDLVRSTLDPLPRDVYITFDIDALEPHLCPNTGTPVPGGLSWDEALLFLEQLVLSKRRIVGFDLTEVAPGTTRPHGSGIDEIVGARLLYALAGYALASLRHS